MRSYRLRTVIFLALCCDLGLFSKRLIAPFTNVITDALHIPGGVGTSFSLMFLVIAAFLVSRFGCAAVMGVVQSVIALGLGMVGSMGILSPIGYIVPALMIDILLWLMRRTGLSQTNRAMLANAAASCCAALTANWIVFRLRGAILFLYLCISLTTGAICGILASELVRRLLPVLGGAVYSNEKMESQKNGKK
ncbi:MAG: hypothetical protein IJ955_03265 [Oscillospiraceae bacterium]|nr:hypothetical protein [Oscillospiraceae bacterium]